MPSPKPCRFPYFHKDYNSQPRFSTHNKFLPQPRLHRSYNQGNHYNNLVTSHSLWTHFGDLP